MQKLTLCVLGRSGDGYTRMVVKCLRERGLQFVLVLEGGRAASSQIERLLSRPLVLYRALTTGRFKALPKLSWFTLKVFLREKLFNRRRIAQEILRPFQAVETEGVAVPSVNHVKTLKLIQDHRFDIGLFAGVGIVDRMIIGAFGKCCLNAHPAPLPQCRGGGALANTLYYGLAPSVSVHFATPGIDEGDIIRVRQLPLRRDDSYESINLRLTVLCAEVLAEVAKEMVDGANLEGTINSGKLHYWKDCTIDIQRAAERRLRVMLRGV